VNGTTPNTFGRALRGFFSDHLPRVRGASCQTVQSYRDTFVLLLRFVAAQRPTAVTKLDLEDLGPQVVLNFLHYLEVERHNIPATRNVRLAAIHAFFRYCAAEHPDRMELCQRILAVPFKRARSRSIEYLEFDEIQAVLTAIDRNTVDGRRDYALLATMFNTGARVQEIVSLRIGDVRFDKPPQVRLFGKGRKERICPLWPQTAEMLREFLAERAGEPLVSDPLFRNRDGATLSRFGVRYILRKHCARAQAARPTLAGKRLHPHSMRHSTAVHLLRAGVDIFTISQWLGHASVTTTNRYATIDIETKRKAIEKAQALEHVNDSGAELWRTDASILAWLEAL
jgi:integrase/recombinase XerD